MARRQGILVARGGALGDFILTLPVLAALRARFPEQRLEILGYPSIAALAVTGGLADEIQPVESQRFTGFFGSNGTWPDEVGQWFKSFDCVISYLHDPEEIFRANVAKCGATQFIPGPHRPDESLGVHASEQLLRPLEKLGIRGADPRPRLYLTAAAPAGRCLALHPGSGSERKNWPKSNWAELLKLLADKSDINVLLIGGEAEGDRCARLATVLPPNRVEVAQNLPIVDLARRMQSRAAFIGHDSGITHLAAALDLPGIVLWGETALATWRPQSEGMKILRHGGGLASLPVTAVWRELQNYL